MPTVQVMLKLRSPRQSFEGQISGESIFAPLFFNMRYFLVFNFVTRKPES